MQYLDGLNVPQREAVLTTQGPVLIVAGPGSGKTRVIVHRIVHLVQDERVAPWNILAVTFTNKAAREMRERLEELLGSGADSVAVGTFHAQCARILRRDGGRAGIDTRFAIFDDGDQMGIVRRILQDMEIDEKRFTPRTFLSAISAAKSELIDERRYERHATGFWQEKVSAVYTRYQAALTENHALDFDDILGETVRLFRENPDVLEHYQDRFRFVMVDEFQDTNVSQYELVRMLGQKHRNVCVVGDEDQSVYSWRKADYRNLKNFENDFPEAKVILLEQNYRSTQTILDVARSIIGGNSVRKDKRLWTENDRGEPVTVHEAYNEEDEAQFVIRETERLIRTAGARYSDVAVMYRTNAQSRSLEDVFVRMGVPYKLIGGTRFYERKEVKDVLAYLRLALNPADAISLGRVLNVPARGIGDKTVSEIQKWASRHGWPIFETLEEIALGDGSDPGSAGSLIQGRARNAIKGFVDLVHVLNRGAQELTPLELLDMLLERTGYAASIRDGTDEGEERWSNILEVRTKAQDFGEIAAPLGLAALLEEVSLVQDVDTYDPSSDGVTLITLHAAKGLEFPYVMIIGMEEGLSPHSRSMDDPAQMEEERRLMYVGVTRAKKGLALVHAHHRMLYGNSMINQPSRFLSDIPLELTKSAFPGSVRARAPQPTAAAGRPTTSYGRSFQRPQPAPTPTRTVSGPGPAAPAAEPKAMITEQQYQPGDRVFHPAFGTGIVVTSVLARGDEEVTVAFEGKGVKKLSVAYAPLQRS